MCTMDTLMQILSFQFVAAPMAYMSLFVLAVEPAIASFWFFLVAIFSEDQAKVDALWEETIDGLFQKKTLVYFIPANILLIFLGPQWSIVAAIVMDVVALIGYGIIIFSALKDFAMNEYGPSGGSHYS